MCFSTALLMQYGTFADNRQQSESEEQFFTLHFFIKNPPNMKLIISKTALEMAVKNICRVINSKNALPILGDVLCILDV